jgi:hypothetical protein
MRVFIIYGQGGIITSYGMYLLANRIRMQWPSSIVTTHYWDDPTSIQETIRPLSRSEKVVLIGYSLGANCVTWVSNGIFPVTIDLAVCYDPSVLSIVMQPKLNVKKLLLYHNTDIEPEGHAVFIGNQVETTKISTFHLAICYSEILHQKTLAAIAQINN